MNQIIQDAIWLGAACGLAAFLGRIRRVEPYFLGLVAICVGIGFWRWNLDARWAGSSFVQDIPWKTVLKLALWAGLSRAGGLKIQGWVGAVLGGILIGDLAVAVSLAYHEPDAGRRARLALAASGASLAGRAGAATLVLGWEPKVAALGLVLALLGYVGGSFKVEGAPPRSLREGGLGALSALGAGVIVWLLSAGGNLEFAALQVEGFPGTKPGMERWLTVGPSLLLGLFFDEGAAAMAVQGVLDRALSVKADWALQSMMAGVGVGGGLQTLLIAKGDLKIGLSLLLIQIGILGAWVFWMQ